MLDRDLEMHGDSPEERHNRMIQAILAALDDPDLVCDHCIDAYRNDLERLYTLLERKYIIPKLVKDVKIIRIIDDEFIKAWEKSWETPTDPTTPISEES